MSRAVAMLSVMVTMLLLARGVALAANQVSCTPPSTDRIQRPHLCSGRQRHRQRGPRGRFDLRLSWRG
jgi:hypothetical protein